MINSAYKTVHHVKAEVEQLYDDPRLMHMQHSKKVYYYAISIAVTKSQRALILSMTICYIDLSSCNLDQKLNSFEYIVARYKLGTPAPVIRPYQGLIRERVQ